MACNMLTIRVYDSRKVLLFWGQSLGLRDAQYKADRVLFGGEIHQREPHHADILDNGQLVWVSYRVSPFTIEGTTPTPSDAQTHSVPCLVG